MTHPYNSLDRPWTPVESIPLDEAVLCEDCKVITRAKNNHCLVCGGHSIVSLARILDRKAQETKAQSGSADIGLHVCASPINLELERAKNKTG